MTTNPQIKFTCPTCGEDRLVELRSQVELKTEVVGVFLTKDPSTGGTKCSVEHGDESGRTDGKVTGFRCDACGFAPMTQPRRTWHPRELSKPKPITNHRGLFLWLKRNNMIEEPANATSSTL